MTDVQVDPAKWQDAAMLGLHQGAGSLQNETACVMTAVSWLTNTKWTDHPEFVHKAIIPIVISANDHHDTTPEDRARMVELAAIGALNTAHLPDRVVNGVVRRYEDEEPLPRAIKTLTWLVAYKNRIQTTVPPETDFDGAA